MNAQLVALAARQGMASVLGAVSQYVLRNAPCPVLTVPEPDIDSTPQRRNLRFSRAPADWHALGMTPLAQNTHSAHHPRHDARLGLTLAG